VLCLYGVQGFLCLYPYLTRLTPRGNYYVLFDLDLSPVSSQNLLNFVPVSISSKPLANFQKTAFSLRIPVLPGTTLSWQQAYRIEFPWKNAMLMLSLNRTQSNVDASLPQD
jgi:hypothetical protein